MSLVVRTGPQEYECRPGVLKTLVERLKIRGIKKAVIVHGEKSWLKAYSHFSELLESEVETKLAKFGSECTYDEVERMVSIVDEFEADVIVGVGGGKLVDTVKYAAAKRAQLQSVIVPTLASNCAPWTPLSVMYTKAGVNLGFDVHSRQVNLLLIDPELLLTAPIDYFIAGIADTLAKWYESDKILTQEFNQNQVFLQAARTQACLCKENIVSNGQKAVEALKAQELSEEFVQVSETIISISGLVGGFGDAKARTTIAHAVHDQLTAYPETQKFLHGEKVGYGVLLQLTYEGNWSELSVLNCFYDSLGLPKSLEDLDLDSLGNREVRELAEAIHTDKNLINSGYSTAPEKLEKAIHSLEKFFNGQKERI